MLRAWGAKASNVERKPDREAFLHLVNEYQRLSGICATEHGQRTRSLAEEL